MERAAGLAHGDTAQTKLDKFDALLAQTSTSAQDISLFADMLSLPNDGRYLALEMTLEQRRQRTLDALGSQVEALARSIDQIETLPTTPALRRESSFRLSS
jgi:hypothetical protein